MTAIEFNTRLLGLQKNLKYYAQTLTANRDDAADLVQDTYLKALLNKDKYTADTNFKAWALTIMKNTFINNYRRNSRFNSMVDTSDDLFNLRIRRESEAYHSESEYAAKEINRSIEKLADSHRLPFEMHTLGFKYKEIADALKLPIGTVKSRIFFSRRKLMNELKDFVN